MGEAKLTKAQERMLRALLEGDRFYRGRALHTGAALREFGLAKLVGIGLRGFTYRITDLGREALRKTS